MILQSTDRGSMGDPLEKYTITVINEPASTGNVSAAGQLVYVVLTITKMGVWSKGRYTMK